MWTPLAYEGPARALVHALKFRGARGVAETMAAQIVACAPTGLLTGSVLVPVPLHPRRRRRRGFNQAALLAAALGRRADLPVADCLMRRGAAVRQVGRDRQGRLDAIVGTVAVTPAGLVPRRAVLVDDVVTTGATLGACADTLRAAGSGELAAVAYARTLGR